MPEPARRRYSLARAGIVAAAFLATAAPATGQTIAEVEARLSFLREQHAEAVLAADRRDSILAATTPVDTIAVGPVRVIAAVSYAGLIRSATEDVWTDFAPIVGSEQPRFEQTMVVYVRGQPEGAFTVLGGEWIELLVDSLNPRSDFEMRARGRIGTELTARLPTLLKDWIGSVPLPVRQNNSWSSLYDRLVMAPSRASRECYLGEIDSCWEAVGISTVEDPWNRWYDDSDLTILVSDRLGRPWPRLRADGSNEALLWDSCVRDRDINACRDFVSQLPPEIPLGYEIREDVFHIALEHGGAGSYTRALDWEGDDLKELLSLISGMEPDELMASWRDRVMSESARRPGTEGRTHLSALIWIVIFGLIAGRSSRWR